MSIVNLVLLGSILSGHSLTTLDQPPAETVVDHLPTESASFSDVAKRNDFGYRWWAGTRPPVPPPGWGWRYSHRDLLGCDWWMLIRKR